MASVLQFRRVLLDWISRRLLDGRGIKKFPISRAGELLDVQKAY